VWSIPERFRDEILTMGRYTNLRTFTFLPLCVFVRRQWIAVPFAATHGAMEGRNIFSKIPELSYTHGNSSTVTTPIVPAADIVTNSNHTQHHADSGGGLEVSWIGTFDPAHSGYWLDSALLLVFGGIPWQVCTVRFCFPWREKNNSMAFWRYGLALAIPR